MEGSEGPEVVPPHLAACHSKGADAFPQKLCLQRCSVKDTLLYNRLTSIHEHCSYKYNFPPFDHRSTDQLSSYCTQSWVLDYDTEGILYLYRHQLCT